MSKVVGKIGKIAISPISLIIGDKATSALLTIAALIPGPHQPFAAAAAAAFTTFSQMSQTKPPARGSVSQVIIASEPPRPYLMGETYSAGVMRYQAGYGAELKKVPNPYLWQTMVYSGVGPVEALVEKQFDFETIGSYYTGFWDSDDQLGARPESTALVPPFGAAPGWDSSSKLSGCAAIGWNFKFDKDGKVFASGIPLLGAVWKGEKAYDPRLDNSQPGGSGSHVLGTESTYTYTTNPALHAGTYVLGRFESNKKIFGLGIPSDGIDWAAVSAWANDCDTNGWRVDGTIYEGGDQSGPDVKAGNLDDICAAGGGRWFTTGAVLTFDWHRPRVSLATFTDKDIMEGGAQLVTLQSHRDRFNEVRPQYRSPAHNWELITAEKIVGTTYVTEDGESKPQTWPFNMVKGTAQAGQLATYAMADSRELGPINLPLGIDWSFYKPGDTLTWQSDILNDTLKLVIVERTPDVENLETGFTFKTETDAKHAFALGKTAVPPPTPVIGQTAAERDAVAGYIANPRGAYTLKTKTPQYPVTPGNGEILIDDFIGVLDDGRSISFPEDLTHTSLATSTAYAVLWDLQEDEYVFPVWPAATEIENSRYVLIAAVTTSDGATYPPAETPPDGVDTGKL